jgi:hypothetical protein
MGESCWASTDIGRGREVWHLQLSETCPNKHPLIPETAVLNWVACTCKYALGMGGHTMVTCYTCGATERVPKCDEKADD